MELLGKDDLSEGSQLLMDFINISYSVTVRSVRNCEGQNFPKTWLVSYLTHKTRINLFTEKL